MASIASSSTSATSNLPEGSHTEAGPLPSKRGEIGYVENTDEGGSDSGSIHSETALPARHPADRDVPAISPTTPNAPATLNTLVSPSSTTLDSSTDSTKKKKRVLHFFNSKATTFGGFRVATLLAFLIQLIFFGGTITGWAIAIKHLTRQSASGLGPSNIFLHVIFGIAVLGQLLFIERRIFRLRAERYSHIHPGQILPSSRHQFVPNPSIAFGPWNRPPLPTYAAALAQSGVGTGDVEDHLIAAPPPPAYGNTRGSTMLLTGFLRDSLRAQRPVSESSHMSQRDERPISYVSRDEQWEEIQDAERARQLEDTLTRLERPRSRS